MTYKKTQIGWFAIWTFIPGIILMYLFYDYEWGNNPLPFSLFLVMCGLFVLILAMFYRLKTEIDGNTIRLSYGIGLIRFRFTIDSLVEAKIIRTPWYYGIGIRITPKGMLYNIHSRDAVEISYLRDGKMKSFMLGSAEPEELKRALDKAFGARA
ncbi:MAG: hypothetical protein ACYC1Q_09910 [Bacteroidia bacterium]